MRLRPPRVLHRVPAPAFAVEQAHEPLENDHPPRRVEDEARALLLGVWGLSMLIGGRVLSITLRRWRAKGPGLASLWLLILIITSCQMMTTLRPIVGRSPKLLDPEKKFFLQNWFETIDKDANRKGVVGPSD